MYIGSYTARCTSNRKAVDANLAFEPHTWLDHIEKLEVRLRLKPLVTACLTSPGDVAREADAFWEVR